MFFDEDLKMPLSLFKKTWTNADGIAGLQTQRFMNIPANKKYLLLD